MAPLQFPKNSGRMMDEYESEILYAMETFPPAITGSRITLAFKHLKDTYYVIYDGKYNVVVTWSCINRVKDLVAYCDGFMYPGYSIVRDDLIGKILRYKYAGWDGLENILIGVNSLA